MGERILPQLRVVDDRARLQYYMALAYLTLEDSDRSCSLLRPAARDANRAGLADLLKASQDLIKDMICP